MRSNSWIRIQSPWRIVGVALALGACARADVKKSAADSAAASAGFRIPAAQLARIHVITVMPSVFRPTVSTTGSVAFNGDRSTQVLSPVSGPVTQILVPLGARVGRGTPLATVSSPDFASAVAAFRKAESSYRQLSRVAALDEQRRKLQNDVGLLERRLARVQMGVQKLEQVGHDLTGRVHFRRVW